MRTVAVLGISGVGKTSLIHQCAETVRFLHLQASDLIKSRLGRMTKSVTSEELRKGPVLDNQQLMIDEFAERIATTVDSLVVFDGHSIVDTPAGLLKIPLSVFAALNLNAIVFVEDAPDNISVRRVADTLRVRPARSVADLRHQQELAKNHATSVAASLLVPFCSILSGDAAGLLSVFR